MSLKRNYKLVSFGICPFVQRSVITLIHKNIPYEVEYIDLDNKPDWFLNQVPTGKVPALFVGDDVLFESAIINEFIDETTEPKLMPTDPVLRARERAWISYVEQLIFDQYKMMIAQTSMDFEQAQETFFKGLGKLSEVATPTTSSLSLLDAAIAPLFTRLKITSSVYEKFMAEIGVSTNLEQWIESLSERSEVKQSVSENFERDWREYFFSRGSYYFNQPQS